jgi:hypothetical protein
MDEKSGIQILVEPQAELKFAAISKDRYKF